MMFDNGQRTEPMEGRVMLRSPLKTTSAALTHLPMTARGMYEVRGELLTSVSDCLCLSLPYPYLTRPYNRLNIVERTTGSAVTVATTTARRNMAQKAWPYWACIPMGGAGGIVLEVS